MIALRGHGDVLPAQRVVLADHVSPANPASSAIRAMSTAQVGRLARGCDWGDCQGVMKIPHCIAIQLS